MTLCYQDVIIGQPVPPFQRKTDLMTWNRFAAVNDEFVDIHMDDEAAKARGYEGVLGMGNLRLAYVHCMLRDWMGDGGLVRAVTLQHRGVNYKNDTLSAGGQVEAKRVENGEYLVDLQLWVENQSGVRLDIGKATVSLPSTA